MLPLEPLARTLQFLSSLISPRSPTRFSHQGDSLAGWGTGRKYPLLGLLYSLAHLVFFKSLFPCRYLIVIKKLLVLVRD